ncbi:Transcriptional regulatory protein YpdB [compost metagenome]
MKKLTCIIVDDDEIDQLMVVSFVKRFPHLELAGAFFSAEKALHFCQDNLVDVIFLDIDMPGMDGLELRKALAAIPACIFVTSHPEHAVESFQLDTLDFIVKPVKLDRFTQTMARVNDYMELKLKASLFESSIGGDVIYIKEGHEQTKVKLHDILYLEALKDYTKIVTSGKMHCVLSNIGTLLKDDNFSSFIRIHRSYAVQKQYIKRILTNEIQLNNDILIPFGRSYKDSLSNLL